MIYHKQASKNQIEQIRQLAFEIFPETYQKLLKKEQIDYMLNMMYSEISLQKQFDTGAVFYLVFEDGIAIGYGSVSVANQQAMLHKIYLKSIYQGTGEGKKFISFLESEAKNKGAQSMQLYVKRDNVAQHFYKKMNYYIVQEVDKEIGEGYFMNDYLMEKIL